MVFAAGRLCRNGATSSRCESRRRKRLGINRCACRCRAFAGLTLVPLAPRCGSCGEIGAVLSGMSLAKRVVEQPCVVATAGSAEKLACGLRWCAL